MPNAGSFHRILAVKSRIINSEFSQSETQVKMQQASVYNLKMLKKLIISSRFNIVDSGSYFLKPFTHLQMQALLDNQIINEQVLDGLFKITEILPGWGAEIFVNAQMG